MQPADFVIEHADLIATCAGPAPRVGSAQREVSPLATASVAARNGVIVFVGHDRDLAHHVRVEAGATRIDATGCTVVPGFVDPHTHLVFAGDRRSEVQQRLAGARYADIAAAGGGITRTVLATRTASEDDLTTAALTRLDEALACGTTTCEIKSGYGLTVESELAQLRVIRRLDAIHGVDVVATFMGAHEIPADCRSRPDDYVSVVVRDMIPRVASAGLAEWCDVFCEHGVFTPAQSETILRAGLAAGLKPRIHAEELGASGGSAVAARVGARSADHLVYLDERGADALAKAAVCATLLPTAAFFLKLGRFAPARMLIEHGVAVALATDINPGGGFSPSMPFVMSLACFSMGLTLEEALIGATLNAAWSLDRADSVGSLEPGKIMDAVLVPGGLTELLRVPSPIRAVVKRGKIVSGQWAVGSSQ